ncbi:hypothetical protein FXO38_07554 [Capsicum annuum]|nr:hypothetical protein FXO38_07554 [Capsicum annuum]
MKQTYMKIFKSYIDEFKDTSIDVLKAELKGVTVLTSSVANMDDDKELSGNNYVSSLAPACNHVGSSGQKNATCTSNDGDLCEHVALLEKTVLKNSYYIRDERLTRIEKNKKKQQDKIK